MKTKKILIIGGQAVGKTTLAKIISKGLNIPITEGVEKIGDLPNKEGVYTTNSISIEVAKIGIPRGFVLIHIL